MANRRPPVAAASSHGIALSPLYHTPCCSSSSSSGSRHVIPPHLHPKSKPTGQLLHVHSLHLALSHILLLLLLLLLRPPPRHPPSFLSSLLMSPTTPFPPLLLLLPSASAARPPPSASSLSDDYGLFRVENMTGRDFPGFDLDFRSGVDRVDCLQACIRRWPACSMVVYDAAASDCWLKTTAVQPDDASVASYPRVGGGMSALIMPCSNRAACGDVTRSVCSAVSERDGGNRSLLRASHVCESAEELHGFSRSFYAFKGTSKKNLTLTSEKDCIKACRYSNVECTVAQFSFADQLCSLYGDHQRDVKLSINPLTRLYTWRCSLNTSVCGDASKFICHNSPGSLVCNDARGWKLISEEKDYAIDGYLEVGNIITDAEGCLDACKKNKECITAQIDPTRNRCFLKRLLPTRNTTVLDTQNRINYVKGARRTIGSMLITIPLITLSLFLFVTSAN